jgi:hypothetical protein
MVVPWARGLPVEEALGCRFHHTTGVRIETGVEHSPKCRKDWRKLYISKDMEKAMSWSGKHATLREVEKVAQAAMRRIRDVYHAGEAERKEPATGCCLRCRPFGNGGRPASASGLLVLCFAQASASPWRHRFTTMLALLSLE